MDLKLLFWWFRRRNLSVSLFKAVFVIININIINIRGFFDPEAPRIFNGQGHSVLPAVPQVTGQCPKQLLPSQTRFQGE